MRLTAGGVGAACLVLTVLLAGCGKKGNPLPPLRPVPARIADFTAVRTEGQVELRFTVPSANLDGTTPVAIDRVDIYALQGTEGQTPPPAGQVAGDVRRVIASLPVRRPAVPGVDEPGTPVSGFVPLPGDQVTYVDDTRAAEQAGAAAMYYVAVPVTGSGRGRSGPPTPVANVPLGALPDAPSDIVLAHDEANITATWQAPAATAAYRVFRAPANGDEGAHPELLTPQALTSASFQLPVVFDRQVCLAVQSVQVSGPVTTAGQMSAPVCITPEDRYPPPTPTGLRVVQEGSAVVVLWDAVDAPDLAGYLVLRAEGTSETFTTLTPEPVSGTTYRDASAAAGTSYSYVVRAVDSALARNASAASAPQSITVR